MATDGEVSYAILIYSNFTLLRSIISTIEGIIGFDAGDGRSNTVLSSEVDNDQQLNTQMIFRIDGNFSLCKAYMWVYLANVLV